MKGLILIIKFKDYIVMSQSAEKSRRNRDQVGDNETIFDFLKRKKQFNLENTINKSLTQHSNTKRKIDIDIEDQFPQTRDLTKYRTHDTYRYAYTSRQTITPKKIEFEEHPSQQKSTHREDPSAPAQREQHRRGKSFLAMISPIKNNRAGSALQERNESKDNEQQPRSVAKTGKSEHFIRKNVTKCINAIKDTMNSLNENIKKIQQKSHSLTLQFKPICSFILHPTEQQAIQIGNFKNKLRSLESLIDGAAIDNCDEIAQTFHKNIEDHLKTELNHLKKESEKEKVEEIANLKRSKEMQIQSLRAQLKKVLKDNEILNRRLQRSESTKDKIEQAITQRQMSQVEQLQRYKAHSESLIKELQNKNAELEVKLQKAQEQARDAEKRYKNERMLKESMQEKLREEVQQITQAKDAYLLNEIMILKAQFNSDIARINQLHRIKETDLEARLAKKQEEIDKKIFEKGCDKQIQSKILEEANRLKQENIQLKTKSECIITDMYRMNEQLYQHWVALKDIKQLSTRLGSFVQYKKIYEDLMFNDQLFH